MSLTRRILTWSPTRERPVDLPVGLAGVAVDEPPDHVARVRCPVDLGHEVFPLEAVARVVAVSACRRRAAPGAAARASSRSSGTSPGSSRTTSGCMGHVQAAGAAAGTSFIPQSGTSQARRGRSRHASGMSRRRGLLRVAVEERHERLEGQRLVGGPSRWASIVPARRPAPGWCAALELRERELDRLVIDLDGAEGVAVVGVSGAATANVPGVSKTTSTIARSDGASRTSSTNVSCS